MKRKFTILRNKEKEDPEIELRNVLMITLMLRGNKRTATEEGWRNTTEIRSVATRVTEKEIMAIFVHDECTVYKPGAFSLTHL